MFPNDILLYILTGSGLVIGALAGKFIFAPGNKKKVADAQQQAQSIIKDAESKAETIRKELTGSVLRRLSIVARLKGTLRGALKTFE